MNKLYVFATPIGNIKDISTNFLEKINEVDVLFCEDTRVTLKLLKILGIKHKIELISFHKYNETKKNDLAITLIKRKQCGLISDAGYPAISDPGYILINDCYQKDIKVEIINGPSALTHAISQCGFDLSNFIFLGFLPRNKNNLINLLNKYYEQGLPIVFFESVHRINETLNIIKNMNLDTRVYIGRELTKKFEEVIRLDSNNLTDVTIKGEFVVIIEKKFKTKINNIDLENYRDDYLKMLELGMKAKNICKFLSYKNPNLKTNDLYKYFNEVKK